MPTAFHAIVRGHVQMVGFRFFAQRAAERRGIRGWVRNCFDGSVEVEAVGERGDIDAFLSELREGPPSSHVTAVDLDWLDPPPEHHEFRIRP